MLERLVAASDACGAAWVGAMYYRTLGWSEEAWLLQKKSETPEPSDWVQRFHMAASRRVTRRYAEGARISRRTIELYSSNWWGYLSLAHCLVEQREFEQGLDIIRKAQEICPKQEMTALKGYAYAKMGRTSEAQEVLSELRTQGRASPYPQPYFAARIYAALGDNSAALDWLEIAGTNRSEYVVFADLGGLRTDPAWDGLQKEPRYWQLCDRVGLGRNQWPRPKPKLERLP